jgi:hypothetical protein
MATSDLCVFGKFYCFGCCIVDKAKPTRAQLENAFKRSTLNYKQTKDTEKFAIRPGSGAVRQCGICNNLIIRRNKVICPLHPGFLGKDLRRDAFCYREYLCETAKQFNRWGKDRQKEFLKFVKSKKPDWYSFSINIDNGTWLSEFIKKQQK